MKLVGSVDLIDKSDTALRESLPTMESSVRAAIERVVWPPGAPTFTILAEKDTGRGKGNGVVPIMRSFMDALGPSQWLREKILHLPDGATIGRFDAVFPFPDASFEDGGKRDLKVISGSFGVVEWETGNISSSHRSLNRMVLGMLHGNVAAGFLVIPTRSIARYLTGRVGNVEELSPYFEVYRKIMVERGVLRVLKVEHDAASTDASVVPKIRKGTDGRALQ